MLPDMGSMGDMMKLMPHLAKAKEAMGNARGAGTSRNSLVKAATRRGEDMGSRLVSVSIDRSLIDPSKPEALEGAILEAVNDALTKEAEALKTALMDLKAGQ